MAALKNSYADGDKLPAKDVNAITTLLNGLSQSGTITEIKPVTALPSDAASHETTLYLVKG